MMLKRNVLILATVLVAVSFAKAENPTSVNTQKVQSKPVVEMENPTSVLTSDVDKVDGQELESIFDDFSSYDSGSLNLSFQHSIPPDSTDFSVIKYYIKHVMPITKSIDSKSYDLMEIL